MAGALAKLSRIRSALESAKTLNDIIDVRDQAKAVATYAKAIGLSRNNVNAAVDVKLCAERKAGALLAGMDLHGGNRGNQHTGGKVTSCDLGNLGITKIQSHRWQKLAAIPGRDYESFRESVAAKDGELTTAALMRYWSAISKPTNSTPKSEPTAAAMLERLRSAVEKLYAQWPEKHRMHLAAKLRAYAEEIEATGGLIL